MNSVLIIGCGHMGSALLNLWSKNKFYKFTVVDPLKYKIINKMNLVKRDEFDVLKRMVQKLLIENENLKKNKKQPKSSKKKVIVRKKNKKK